jgi:hypothetical protein
VGFTPAERPRLAVAVDGTLAAIHEPARVSVAELPNVAPFAEIGIDPEAGSSDVAWVGMPPRLLVLSRYAAHSTVHLLDPYGPRTIAEIRLESPMKLVGTIGSHALAVGALGAAVLSATETHLTPYQFPARAVPAAGGAAGGQFVVALPGAIEEWDPAARMPKRRLKLPRPAVITALGGSERVVWMTTQQDPTRIDVIPLVNRGQPKVHELPEPIAHVAAHPRTDLLACIGADSGRLYVLDLDGRAGMRIVGPERVARVEAAALVVGRNIGVLAAQAKHPVAFVSLDGREQPEPAPPPVAPPAEPEPPPKKSTLFEPEPVPDIVAPEPPKPEPPKPEPEKPRPSLFRPSALAPAAAAAKPAPAAVPKPVGPSISERFSVWRERMRNAQPRTGEASAPVIVDRRPTWRDEAVTWYRAVAAGADVRKPPISTAIDQLLVRLELPPELHPALVLLYGAHLAGDGAAPIDVARVLDRNWAEALGRGQLAERGITRHADSRVRLAPAIQRALDELPPATGTLVGEPGAIALLGPCAIVASADAPLVELATRFLGHVGSAILAGHDHAPASEIVFEARAHGAVPMVRTPVDAPAIIVAATERAADELGLPRID